MKWIENFLTGREQQVVINGSASGWAPVISGVPQGSVLGPLMFLLFINDLPDEIGSVTKIFADDTKIYAPIPDKHSAAQLQNDIRKATEWSERWLLPFNETKCCVLHVGTANSHEAYHMRSTALQGSSVEKDLGVFVDEELKFRQHAASAASKANQNLAVIRRSFKKIDRETLPLLYKTLVRPHLEYGNLTWGPFNRADQQLVERVQRRATRMVMDIREKPYCQRLQDLDLPSLYYRRKRGDMIRVYQVLHSQLELSANILERERTHRTRGHPLKLVKPTAISRIRRNSFAVRVINDWNSLPTNVVTAPSTGSFKARLDSHWTDLKFVIPDTD